MYTLDQINDDMIMLDKLDTFIENAMYRYNTEVLFEAESGDAVDPEAKNKAQKIWSAVAKAWSKFWEWVEKIVSDLLDNIRFKVRGGEKAVLKRDLEVSVYTMKDIPNEIYKIFNTINSGADFDKDECRRTILKYQQTTTVLPAGKAIDIKAMYSNLSKIKNNIRNMKKPIKNFKGTGTIEGAILTDIRNFFKAILNDCRAIISQTGAADKKTDAAAKKSASGRQLKTQNDSVSYIPENMSRNEFIANLMLEAADLLKDDVFANNSYDEERQILQETVDFLYERALLCEEAEDSSAYVEKAEELQKAIEDIPEEKPVQQDEYNTSTVGGDDEKPELEEIKDLCDNDPDVVKLLTDDEDKSVTVDASEDCSGSSCDSNNESALSFFDMSF